MADDNLEPHEDFLGVCAMEKTTSEVIVDTIKGILLRYELPLMRCLGHCYVGAAVMSGAKAGVATHVKNVSHFLG